MENLPEGMLWDQDDKGIVASILAVVSAFAVASSSTKKKNKCKL